MKWSICIVAALSVPARAEVTAKEPALTGNVLVWADAQLYLDPSTSGPYVKVGVLDLGRDKDVGYVVPMKVVSTVSNTSGDFIEVESTADTECAWWRLAKPEGLDTVRLFVKREDLAPVLTKDFKAKHKDGTSISLQAGVAVLGDKVGFNRGVVPVTIPAASIGIAYTPHKIAPVPKPVKKFLLDEATDVKVLGVDFKLGPWVAAAATVKGKRSMVSIAARCMSAVISAPKERVHKGVAINQELAAGAAAASRAVVGNTSERYILPAGTKLTSEKGSHVVATLETDREINKPKAGARACSEFVITKDDPYVDSHHTVDASQPVRTLKLCAEASAMKTERK